MNRRQFLAAASVGLATGCVTPPLSGRKLRLSTSSIHFRDLPIEQACERIAGLEFNGVDLWSPYEGCAHLDQALNRLGGAGLKALLKRTGLELTAFSTYVGGFAKYASLMGELGGGLAIQGSAAPVAPEELIPKMKLFFVNLRPLAELAAEHKCSLAIENHGSALLDGLDSFKAFVDLNPYPQVGIALAPYHLQARRASVPEAIRIAGSQLRFFYAWQKADGLAQLPGHGPADFAPWFAALREIRYPWFVNPFMHGFVEPAAMADALEKSRDHLKSLASAR
jgi:sugar phosphate isomerase/epimerase